MTRKANLLMLLAAGLCVASPTYAQQADTRSPDLVLINGKVLTMDGRSSVVEALAVLDGKILATGSNASVKAIVSAQTRVLDLAGKTVVPGLIDTHAHFRAAGLSEYVVIMNRAKTVVEALDAIKAFAAGKKPGEWVVGSGWHPPSQLAEKRLDNLGAGTDFPVNPVKPLLNMYVMVARKDINGKPYGASEAISREQALRLHTSAAARYTFDEGRKGTLEPGKLADLAVLSADYLTVSEDQIKEIKADVTMVGGKVVFQR